MARSADETINWNKAIEQASSLPPIQSNYTDAQVEARQQRFDTFFASLSKSEKKSLQKAGDMDGLLKAIFKLDSPEKIKEALTLAASDGGNMGTPEAASLAMPMGRKQASLIRA